MSDTSTHRYALALGSNRALSSHRSPARLIGEAVQLIAEHASVLAVAPVIATLPMGPSSRTFANSAMVIETALPPAVLLRLLQSIERRLGRRRHRRWGARSMDIDIILWSGGRQRSRSLTIPHAAFRERDFVLRPLVMIAPHWIDPLTGHSVAHLHARLKKQRKRLTSHAAPIR